MLGDLMPARDEKSEPGFEMGEDGTGVTRPQYEEVGVERVCFIATLRPGSEDEYKIRHDEIWPEMEVALREAGWMNYSIFRRGRTIVGYAECHPSVRASMAAIEANETNARWSHYVADLFSEARDEAGGLLLADEVWHLSEQSSTAPPLDPAPF